MQKRKKLKTGFTTGAAAAAAAKGALCFILEKKAPPCVQVTCLSGERIVIPIDSCAFDEENRAVCTVIKDAGDDPDITHRAKIGAKVSVARLEYKGSEDKNKVSITGGKGVGRVTKPGLEVKPGEPAINPGPVKMITLAVMEVLQKHNRNRLMPVNVEVFVPEGEKLAQKTLNARLGILGGISILGTTGIVKPMSHDAYIATIESSLSVAKAIGLDKAVLTTGRRSERYAQAFFKNIREEAFIQIGDFFKISLENASKKGFKWIILAIFFGKAVKMAQGIAHTHAKKSTLTMHKLSKWSFEVTKDYKFSQNILSANTARHAFDIIYDKYPEVISYVGKYVVKSAQGFTGPGLHIQSVIFDYKGGVIFNSEK